MVFLDSEKSNFILSAKTLLKKIEDEVSGKVIFLGADTSALTSILLHKVLRKLGETEKLFLILESAGGSIDAAAKIYNICRLYSKEFNVIVPFYAKSAATIIALNADNLYLGKAGELGPVDPQVKHPVHDIYFPASAIKDALDIIENSKDPFIKMGLVDKIDPYLIGTYKRILNESKQYLEKAKIVLKAENKNQLIIELTEKYVSHGFPFDINLCNEIGIKTSKFDNNGKVMDMTYELFELFFEFVRKNEILENVTILSMNDSIIECKTEEQIKVKEDKENE